MKIKSRFYCIILKYFISDKICNITIVLPNYHLNFKPQLMCINIINKLFLIVNFKNSYI